MLGFNSHGEHLRGRDRGISSTTIIVKAFQEQKVKGRVTELVFGILIIEDLIAIFLPHHSDHALAVRRRFL